MTPLPPRSHSAAHPRLDAHVLIRDAGVITVHVGVSSPRRCAPRGAPTAVVVRCRRCVPRLSLSRGKTRRRTRKSCHHSLVKSCHRLRVMFSARSGCWVTGAGVAKMSGVKVVSGDSATLQTAVSWTWRICDFKLAFSLGVCGWWGRV